MQGAVLTPRRDSHQMPLSMDWCCRFCVLRGGVLTACSGWSSMGDFYSDMAKMARDLLAPTSMGGLGQGVLELTRVTPGVPDPDQPWLPVQPVRQTVRIRGAVRGISAELVGKDMNGTVLVASDRVAICAVPSIEYTAGDVFTVDGVPVHVIEVEKIPAAG